MGAIDFDWGAVLEKAPGFGFLDVGGQAGEAIATLIKGILPPCLFLASVWLGLSILWAVFQLLPAFLVRQYGTERLSGPAQPTMPGFKQSWFKEF